MALRRDVVVEHDRERRRDLAGGQGHLDLPELLVRDVPDRPHVRAGDVGEGGVRVEAEADRQVGFRGLARRQRERQGLALHDARRGRDGDVDAGIRGRVVVADPHRGAVPAAGAVLRARQDPRLDDLVERIHVIVDGFHLEADAGLIARQGDGSNALLP